MVEGRWYGTMALSEPQAGSSLGDITTRAVRQDDGSYRLTGTKMWISGGDHELGENIVHLVLAKAPDAAPGTKGISLFIVPKHLVADDGSLGERNDVALVGLNHKMGYRGTTNTLLNFGEGVATPGGRAGAVGYLVGEEGRGLTYMFQMMNEARIGVGAGAVALGYTGYLHALEYARARTQGRPARRARTRPRRRSGSLEHPDVRRMLLAQKSYVEGGLALVLLLRPADRRGRQRHPGGRRARGRAAARRAHPDREVAGPRSGAWPPTTWPSRCSAATATPATTPSSSSTATTGSTRSTRAPTASRRSTCSAARSSPAAARRSRVLTARMRDTVKAARDLPRRARGVRRDRSSRRSRTSSAPPSPLWGEGDPALALANATLYLEAFGHLVVAWLWLEQLVAVGDREGSFDDGKRAAARYFFPFELPTIGPEAGPARLARPDHARPRPGRAVSPGGASTSSVVPARGATRAPARYVDAVSRPSGPVHAGDPSRSC